MIINTNMKSLNAQRNLGLVNKNVQKSLEKLSSGQRINRAADDAAGLAISEKMRAQIRGLKQALRNAQDGISLIQTAEGALNETHAVLQRMRELAVQAANGTYTDDDREKIQVEMDQLAKEISRISDATEFNQQNLLAGFFDAKFQVGANEGQTVEMEIGAMDAYTLGVAESYYSILDNGGIGGVKLTGNALITGNYSIYRNGNQVILYGTNQARTGAMEQLATTAFVSGATTISIPGFVAVKLGSALFSGTLSGIGNAFQFDVKNSDPARMSGGIFINAVTRGGPYILDSGFREHAITRMDDAISKVSNQRAQLGALQNRLEHTIRNLGVAEENLTFSESTIRDVDMAAEMAAFTKNQILNQSGTAMLAQANQTPQGILKLLG